MAAMIIDRGNVAIATVSKTFADLGFDSTNIHIIFEVGSSLKSWKPGRSINAINKITAGRGYWVVPKIALDIPELGTTFEELLLDGAGTVIVYP